MMPMRRSVPILCLAVVAAGCGGGGGPSTGNGGSTSQTIGNVHVSYVGKPVAFTALGGTGGNVTVTGLAGAAFSSVSLEPQPNLQQTSVAYTNVGGSYSNLWSVTNGAPTELTDYFASSSQCSFSPDGRIAFCMPVNGANQIFVSNLNGTGLIQVTTSGANDRPAWSPDGSKLAYDNDGGFIFISKPTAGATHTVLKWPGTQPSWTPDGQWILYCATTSATQNSQIYLQSATANSNASPLYLSQFYELSNCTSPAISPTKNYIAYVVTNNFESSIVFASASSLPTSAASTQTVFSFAGNGLDGQPTFSPDGTQIAFARQTSSGSPTQIYTSDLAETTVSALNQNGTTQIYPAWSPFLATRNFVGTSAVASQTAPYYASAAGFLWSQVGSAFACFAAFTAKTPSTATVTNVGQGTGAIVEHIHADSITGLSYSNGYYLSPTVVPTGNVSDLLISFDPNSGTIQTIAPYLASGQ